MGITDELKDFAKNWDWLDRGSSATERKILDIASRIDNAHFAARADACDTGVNTVLKDPESFGLMALPKDADGEYIHVGDIIEWLCGIDSPFEVVGIGENGTLYYISDGSCEWTNARGKRHYNPAVRDVLFEFAKRWDDDEELTDINHLDPSFVQVIDEFAARLQLRED